MTAAQHVRRIDVETSSGCKVRAASEMIASLMLRAILV